MLKTVLVYPPMVFGKKRNFGFPPLGILYIASFLKKNGIQAKVMDSFIEGHTLEELTKLILKEAPDVIGFSTMTCQVNTVLDIARKLKQLNPGLKIAVGGAHIGSTKEELFDFTKDVDFLFYGEAENSFYKFLEALGKGAPFDQIKGLIYKKDAKVVINSPVSPMENLDELPFPDFGMLDIYKYDSYYAKSLPLAPLMASRGCPYSCTFCDAYVTHGKALRLRSAQNVVDEIEYNYRNRIRQFMIKDSTFTVNKKWIHEICSEIIKRGLKIHWTCNSRVDLVDEDILKIMKKSGCYMVLFGIESGSQKSLDALKKGITLEQIRAGMRFCKKTGMHIAGYFMIGNPGEKEKDAMDTLTLSREIGLDLVTFGVTVAYPGTELYKWAIDNKALPDRFWYMNRDIKVTDSIREMCGNLNLKDFPIEKQLKVAKKANRQFYFRPAYVAKSIFKIRRIHDLKRVIKAVRELL